MGGLYGRSALQWEGSDLLMNVIYGWMDIHKAFLKFVLPFFFIYRVVCVNDKFVVVVR